MESIKRDFQNRERPVQFPYHAAGQRLNLLSVTPAAGFSVTLYGSLAATGKGHFTDKALEDAFSPKPVEII